MCKVSKFLKRGIKSFQKSCMYLPVLNWIFIWSKHRASLSTRLPLPMIRMEIAKCIEFDTIILAFTKRALRRGSLMDAKISNFGWKGFFRPESTKTVCVYPQAVQMILPWRLLVSTVLCFIRNCQILSLRSLERHFFVHSLLLQAIFTQLLQHQAFIWTNDDLLSNGSLGTNLNKLWIKLYSYSRTRIRKGRLQNDNFFSASTC